MTRPSPRTGRRLLLSALVLAALAWPVTAFVGGTVLNFFADFNQPASSAPGSNPTFQVAVGSAVVFGPQNVFDIAFPGIPENGVLEIAENAGVIDAVLVCEMDKPAHGDRIDVGWSMSAFEGSSELDVRFNDVGDTGILDVHIQDDRHLVVNGIPVDLPLFPGETDFHVDLVLEQHTMGFQTWTVTVTGPQASITRSGPLSVGTLNIGTIDIIREAGAVGGVWHLDNLLVTSQSTIYQDMIPVGGYRQK